MGIDFVVEICEGVFDMEDVIEFGGEGFGDSVGRWLVEV